MDWIAERARRENLISAKAETLWNALRTALSRDLDSFNEHYSKIGRATPREEIPSEFRFSLLRGSDHFRAANEAVSLEFDGKSIKTTGLAGRTIPIRIGITDTDEVVFEYDQGENKFLVGPEELSRSLLEPFLFASKQPTTRRGIRA
jgi:hypothetical protein